ncbi:MAG: flagellar FliJ family protein [Gammaproteobacteria bacterium]|nr:flagellar FliJ family protein [Gammaproteobacteria bacterium]
MKRSLRLDRLARLARTTEQVAAQAQARAQQDLAHLEAQQRELRSYQAEYLKRFAGGDAAGLRGYEAQKLRVFVQRVEEAILAMEQRIAMASKRCELERAKWLAQRRRVEAQSTLVVRARAEESVVTELRLEREIDDRRRLNTTGPQYAGR